MSTYTYKGRLTYARPYKGVHLKQIRYVGFETERIILDWPIQQDGIYDFNQFIETAHGYYVDNVQVPIPDGCYENGELVSYIIQLKGRGHATTHAGTFTHTEAVLDGLGDTNAVAGITAPLSEMLDGFGAITIDTIKTKQTGAVLDGYGLLDNQFSLDHNTSSNSAGYGSIKIDAVTIANTSFQVAGYGDMEADTPGVKAARCSVQGQGYIQGNVLTIATVTDIVLNGVGTVDCKTSKQAITQSTSQGTGTVITLPSTGFGTVTELQGVGNVDVNSNKTSGVSSYLVGQGGLIVEERLITDTYIYVGSRYTVKKYDNVGNHIWDSSEPAVGSSIKSVAVDASGNTFTAGQGGAGGTVKKFLPSGSREWVVSIPYNPNTVDVGNDGYSYSGNNNALIRKHSPTGSIVWTYEGFNLLGHTRVNAVVVDSLGFVYGGSQAPASTGSIHKISPTGDFIWEFSGHTKFINSLALDAEGNLYSSSYDGTIKKIDPDGNQVWSTIMPGPNNLSIALDRYGNVYVGSSHYSPLPKGSLTKLNPYGNIIWSIPNSESIWGVTVDFNDDVYTSDQGGKVIKRSPDGTTVWEVTTETSQSNLASSPKIGAFPHLW